MIWITFEVCILFMLQDNPKLMKRIVAIGNEIGENNTGIRLHTA
jgi:hypothetical protein